MLHYCLYIIYNVFNMPDSLQSSMHGIIASKDYSTGVQAHIKVGGDGCG